MAVSAAARVGRFYTGARRHPWVLGKVADWKIPLGPYTPAQIAVAVVGGFLLEKTVSWWSVLGPVPIATWVLAIWAVRRQKIHGRAPLQAALGWVLLGWQPRGGRIGGRAARDRAARALLGGFTIEGIPEADRLPAGHGPARWHNSRRRPAHPPVEARPSTPLRTHAATPAAQRGGPASGVQQLLALAVQDGGAR
ncbi:hypothetical protein [Streptomyces sp. TLI_55]|uniref:hypothetical protein n=1 Tax=Streptomyces sp. TLI_55 TaxID=1938861 RepID=UPI0015CF6E79|nr:hypothetical protein [Streptomyces sp. TLI_55]